MKKNINAMLLCFILSSNMIVATKLLHPVTFGQVKKALDAFKCHPDFAVKGMMVHQYSDKDLILCMNGMVKEVCNLNNGRCANYPNGRVRPLIHLKDEKLEEIFVKSMNDDGPKTK